MPMIDLTLPTGALQPPALTTLVEDLTTIVLRWEGVADNPATPSQRNTMVVRLSLIHI